jgi:pilus assembly protein Flp/PilA
MTYLNELIVRLMTARPEKGQGLVEYGLIIVLVALAVTLTLTAVGGQLNTLFTNITTALGA